MHHLTKQMATWQSAPQLRGGFLPPIKVASSRRQPMFGQRPSFGALSGRRQLGLPRYGLGQTAETWYQRAGSAIARFDFLKGQIASIDNIGARDAIVRWLGNPQIKDPPSPEYRYTTVVDDYVNKVGIKGIEGTYGVDPESESGPARRQGRIEKLESVNEVFNEKIASAQATHGTQPVPGGTGVIKPPAKTTNLTVPILIGAGAIALAIFASTKFRK